MAGSEEVRYMLKKRKKNIHYLAELLGVSYNGARNKLYRNAFSYADILLIANNLGFEISMEDQQEIVKE